MISELAFIRNNLDRQADERSDTMVLDLKNQNPLYVLVQGVMLIYKDKQPLEVFLQESDLAHFSYNSDDACYLGRLQQRPIIAFSLKDKLPETLPENYKAVHFRESFIKRLFPQNESGVVAQAGALLNWHKNHGFCSNCGTKTKNGDGGAKRVCDNCKREHFPRTDPVAIMLVHRQDKCLLARANNFENGRYSCLAGFVEHGETIEQTVRRESFEEMGVKIGEVTYLASQPWPFPYSLMFGFHAKALSDTITIDHKEMADGRWFLREDVKKMMNGKHEEGFTIPPKGTLARHLIENWVFQDI